ncbi:hypothetical protein QWA_17700, partial [Alcaligenes faecalis subsp. faecalis NCIB 8687]
GNPVFSISFSNEERSIAVKALKAAADRPVFGGQLLDDLLTDIPVQALASPLCLLPGDLARYEAKNRGPCL